MPHGAAHHQDGRHVRDAGVGARLRFVDRLVELGVDRDADGADDALGHAGLHDVVGQLLRGRHQRVQVRALPVGVERVVRDDTDARGRAHAQGVDRGGDLRRAGVRADHDVGLKALVDVEELLAQVVRELLVHLDGKGDVLLRLLHHAEGLAEHLGRVRHRHAVSLVDHLAEGRLDVVKRIQELADVAALHHPLHDALGGLVVALPRRYGQE